MAQNAQTSRKHARNKLNDLTGSEWLKFTKSWFILNPRQRVDAEFTHPAKFPEELVEKYVSFFTKKGQVVFDPFLGIGSTIIGSSSIGRKSIGVEYSEKYVALAKARLVKLGITKDQKIICGNSLNLLELWQEEKNKLPNPVDFIITSPPYWNMLGESRGNILSTHQKRTKRGLDAKYSDNKADLGNITDYRVFLKNLRSIFYQCSNILKKNGYMVVVLQNLRLRGGKVQTLAWDLVKELEGPYEFAGEQLWLQANKQLGVWGYPSTFVSNVHHHYCLIFRHKGLTEKRL